MDLGSCLERKAVKFWRSWTLLRFFIFPLNFIGMFHETLLMNSVGFGSLVSVFGMEWNGLYSANIDSASGMGRGLSEPSPAQGGGGGCTLIGFSGNTSRTDRPIVMKLGIPST